MITLGNAIPFQTVTETNYGIRGTLVGTTRDQEVALIERFTYKLVTITQSSNLTYNYN